MNIQVFAQNELINHIEQGKVVHSHCISITNPGSPRIEEDTSHQTPRLFHKTFSEVLELKFWDSNREDTLRDDADDKTLPSQEHITQVLEFIERTKETATGYTIHCWRGISRSTAIAYGILFFFLHDEKSAAEALVGIRRQAMPLKLICELYDKAFGSHLSSLNRTIYAARIRIMREELVNAEDKGRRSY